MRSLLLRLLAALPLFVSLNSMRADEAEAVRVYERLRTSTGMEAFLRAFPKGGDLHNHLAAHVTPETWIEIAIQRNGCVDEANLLLFENGESTCPAGTAPAATLRNGGPVYDRFINAMSMRGIRGSPEKGHDYFFHEVFGHTRFRDVFGTALEVAVVHANEQNLIYLEPQFSPFNAANTAKVFESLAAEGSLNDWLAALDQSRALQNLVEEVQLQIQKGESELLQRRPAEAASIRRRYIITCGRNASPRSFFTQLAGAARLIQVDRRVVGLNIAGPEDGAVSLRDFRSQMRMIDFILARKPWIRVTLHAGELTRQILGAPPGAVPDALTFHIAESVWDAHAERIGHGTALAYERDGPELLRSMRERGVIVEICLTSERLIQNLNPGDIPFEAYWQAGVPVSLNTDDAGVLGSDLTNEFLRAAGDYRLRYEDLKMLARNSIEYSFLPGHSLFRTREFKAWVPACGARVAGEDVDWPAYQDRLGRDCRAYLDNNPKAEAQARLEYQFQRFESSSSLRRFQR
jgi:adenosine deaminase